MSKFYTNVLRYGNQIYLRGYDGASRVKHKVEFLPTLFVPSKTPTEWKSMHGKFMSPIKPGTMRDCKDFMGQYEDVPNFEIHGNTNYHIQAIHEWYPDHIQYDTQVIRSLFFDIETHDLTGGYVFPDDHKVLVRKKTP